MHNIVVQQHLQPHIFYYSTPSHVPHPIWNHPKKIPKNLDYIAFTYCISGIEGHLVEIKVGTCPNLPCSHFTALVPVQWLRQVCLRTRLAASAEVGSARPRPSHISLTGWLWEKQQSLDTQCQGQLPDTSSTKIVRCQKHGLTINAETGALELLPDCSVGCGSNEPFTVSCTITAEQSSYLRASAEMTVVAYQKFSYGNNPLVFDGSGVSYSPVVASDLGTASYQRALLSVRRVQCFDPQRRHWRTHMEQHRKQLVVSQGWTRWVPPPGLCAT